MENQKHVLVAMSGGVDSSMAAALLLERGYRVSGVMLRLWCNNGIANLVSTEDAIAQAQAVAKRLDISFSILDAAEPFREKVVKYFIDENLAGKTPNPCYFCNSRFRWDLLLNYAESIGADFLATGHYARLQDDAQGNIKLLKAADKWKDQSYMLSGLKQKHLRRTLFPLSEMTKNEIREKAKKINLPVAERKDSQDLCFLGDMDYRDFLKNQQPEVNQRGGMIVNLNGEVLGHHEGLAFYTIGQRKGLKIAFQEPLYVIRKESKTNHLVIGIESELGSSQLTAGPFNWINGEPLKFPGTYEVKIRYRAEPRTAIVEPLSDEMVKITFQDVLRDITPGQIAVVYDGDWVLGSGIIQ